jgi:ketosteroid isomerase-like protein
VEVWELAARESIRETVASYAHSADSGRFAELASLFAPDGVLEVGGEPPLVGRDAIRGFLEGVGSQLRAVSTVPMIRHHVSNLTISVGSPTAARGACYFLAVTEHGVDHWGRYRDDYAPDGDRWLFAHRTVRTDGTTPGGWAEGRIAQSS